MMYIWYILIGGLIFMMMYRACSKINSSNVIQKEARYNDDVFLMVSNRNLK